MVDVEHDVELPVDLVERLPAEALVAFRSWWASLAAEERAELGASWDAEDVVLGVVDDGAVTVLLEARFVEPAELEARITRDEDRQAKEALREWIVGHPEYAWGLAERLVHVCRAHPKAREVVRAGFVPADFRCPLANEGCPMRKLLAVRPGHAVVLSVVGARRRRLCSRSFESA